MVQHDCIGGFQGFPWVAIAARDRSRSPAPSAGALVDGLDSDASPTPAAEARPQYPFRDDPSWYPGALEGLTLEQWSHLIAVRTEFRDILREDFAFNGYAERKADFLRSIDAPLIDYSTRNTTAGSGAWQIRYRNSRLHTNDDELDSQGSSISPLEEVDADPPLGLHCLETSVMSDHPRNRQWNYLLEKTYDAPGEWTRFDAPRFDSENAAFYASYDAATMVEELMAVGRGPPGPLFVSNPDDWVRRAPGAPILHGPSCQPSASSDTSPRVSAEVRHYWTMRAQEALADDDSRSSSSSPSQNRLVRTPAYYENCAFCIPHRSTLIPQPAYDEARVTGNKVSPSRMLGFPGPPPFGHFCSLRMLSRDIPAAKQVYDKNVRNLSCSGIDSPSMLLQWCIDMWLAVASATVEPQITQEALNVCLRVIGGMNSDDRLSFASEWSATILDSVLTDALEIGGVAKGLWFQSDAFDSSKVPGSDRPTRSMAPSPSSESASKRARWARKRIHNPVIALLSGQSFVDFVTPDHPLDEEMGGSAPEVSSGFAEVMTPSTFELLSVAGVLTCPEVIDRYTTEERWKLTNVPSFPWPLDKVCFQMATSCSIPELTALVEPLMSSLRLLTAEEASGFEYGMALKELLSLYLVRRQRLDHAPCTMPPEIVLKAGYGRWKLNMTQGSPRWTFLPGSVIPSSSYDHEIDINSSYETLVGGLAHLPDSCNASNIAANAMSYCDLRRKRGEQKPFSDALWRVACGQFEDKDYDQEGTFMRIADLDQKASAFHPSLVQGQDLVSEICTPPFAEMSEVARPLNRDNEARPDPGLNTELDQELVSQCELSGPGRFKHANMEEISRAYWNDDTTTTLQAKFMHSKPPVKDFNPNATEANSVNSAPGFDSKGTWLRYRNNNHWNQDLRNAIDMRSGRLSPPGVPTLLTHDEVVNASKRYITTAMRLDLSTFGEKLLQEVPELVREEGEWGPDFNQPPPIGIIHYMLNSNKGQLRLADAEWCLIPGPLDINASCKVWQKDTDKGWGEYPGIESMTRALRDCGECGHRNYWNCVSSLQIEADTLARTRPTPIGCSPLVGIYLQNKENFHWERKVSFWDLPSLLRHHGATRTAKELWDYWSNLVTLRSSKKRGSRSKSKPYLARMAGNWMVSKGWMDCFLNSNGYLAPTTLEERAMINKRLGMFLAATHFLTKNPSFIMEIQNIQGHPGYAPTSPGMRWRPQLDERVIVPLDSFPPVVQAYFKKPTGKWAHVDVFFRCNTTLYWVESVVDEPPREQGATGPEGLPEEGTQVGDGKEYSEDKLFPFRIGSNYHWSEPLYNSQYWIGWVRRRCNGGWDDKKTGSHFIQINDGANFLQIILDSPDKFLWNRWIMERADCMRLEPNEPSRIPAPTLANAQESHRRRFKGEISDEIWKALYTNPVTSAITELDLLAASPIQGKKALDFRTCFVFNTSPLQKLWKRKLDFCRTRASETGAFAALPQHIFRSQLAHGYVGIQEDGELLKLMLDADVDKSLSDELVKSALALLPDDLSGLAAQEIATCLEMLGKRRKLLEEGAPGPESSAVLSAVSKWRHWSPRMITDMEPVTQKELERRLRLKWVQRLVDLFAPHWEHIPSMQKVRYNANYNMEYAHLFGAARWGSLRGHCLNLENIMKLGAGFIPWTADKVRNLLNCCEEKKWTPSQVQRAWCTCKFLSGILGMLEPDTVDSLQKKKEAVSDSLVTALLLPQHRAEVPALDLIMRMETGCVAPGPPADQYAMAFARFLVGCSGRLSVVPLIAPLQSFTGIPWWETLEKFVKLFSENYNFSNLDYLLPMVTKDRTGFIPRPMANSTGLRWIRTVLTRLGAPAAQVAKLTWPSFRVFFADWAFQAGITRDRRRYIGRWASEATADEYTRERRSVVCDIWNEVTPQTDKIRAGYSATEDLNHKDYKLYPDAVAAGVPDPETATNSAVTVPDAGTVGVPDLETTTSSAVTMTPTVVLPVAGPVNTSVSTAPASANMMVGCRTILAANDVPEHAGGPLTVICATKNTGSPASYKIHLLKVDGICVGCAWTARREAFSNLNEQDFQTANTQGMNACASGPDWVRNKGRLHDLRTWRHYVQPTFGPGLLVASARQAFALNVDLLHTNTRQILSNAKIDLEFNNTIEGWDTRSDEHTGMCVSAFPYNLLFNLEKHDLVAIISHEGLCLQVALNKVTANSLFWTREVYKKVSCVPVRQGQKASAPWRTRNLNHWHYSLSYQRDGKGDGKVVANAAIAASAQGRSRTPIPVTPACKVQKVPRALKCRLTQMKLYSDHIYKVPRALNSDSLSYSTDLPGKSVRKVLHPGHCVHSSLFSTEDVPRVFIRLPLGDIFYGVKACSKNCILQSKARGHGQKFLGASEKRNHLRTVRYFDDFIVNLVEAKLDQSKAVTGGPGESRSLLLNAGYALTVMGGVSAMVSHQECGTALRQRQTQQRKPRSRQLSPRRQPKPRQLKLLRPRPRPRQLKLLRSLLRDPPRKPPKARLSLGGSRPCSTTSRSSALQPSVYLMGHRCTCRCLAGTAMKTRRERSRRERAVEYTATLTPTEFQAIFT
ncbi:unnamed protein product [Polarella glacialis]|uniref:Uncharacterized protein n=1 Tax=Polarella glacialis TaxID=89957 RepID=A0A813FFM0_POLGL|nr:unnamed protein product [Polarella glacialis]